MVKLFGSQKSSPRLDRLHGLSLFVNLTPAELRIVDGLLHERSYLAGEVIFDEGEEGQAIYIIASGEVLISRLEQGDAERFTPAGGNGLPRRRQGDSGRVAELGPGTFFGELALLDNSPRSAQARAATGCQLIIFFRDDFVGLLDTHARIASKISRQLACHLGARMRVMAQAMGNHQHAV
ncbi:MAG: cyclic nucleotide-binding domain-containing protein [Sulfuritalea sp.]|nr:cyclic nucleotide-binding domain-containing protein [Sulfuritalea sp.]MBK8762151.1 cyclic nucleotide-binding domain-containing protein [Sulfuritalea sp.]